MNRFLMVLVAILATAAALAQCGGDETPAEGLETCTSCDALEVNPQQGKVPCNGTCNVEPDATESYKCVGVVDGAGGTCVPSSESYNMCGGGVDDDADGLTDCDDPDCVTNLLCVPVPCVPDCDTEKCGDDGCDGSCGTCAAWETCMDNGTCYCPIQCDGKNCGDNGCGGTCGTGTCPDGMTCGATGLCEVTCVPDCDTEVCGNDGCDGDCGPGCADDEVCTAVGDCILAACPKQCDDKECGPDGCGSFCGVCPLGEECNAAGICEVVPCEPDCDTEKCGSDGCGGSCGVCVVGTCLANGTCMCVKQCGGKNCGDDGCNGTCGDCPVGMTCGATGLCAPEPCVPNCGVKVCGNNGCGGFCGTCAAGEECTATGTCIPTGPVVPAEVCDNGVDDDGDSKADADDTECVGKVVAVLGLYVAAPAFLATESANGQSWEGDIPADWTVTVTVLGGETPTKVWVNTKSVSATSPQGFVVWDGGVGIAPPNWPLGGGLPIAPGKSFSASFSEATWFNFQL